jgi:hypothetical protein
MVFGTNCFPGGRRSWGGRAPEWLRALMSNRRNGSTVCPREGTWGWPDEDLVRCNVRALRAAWPIRLRRRFRIG